MILFFGGDFVTFQGRTSQTSGGYVSYFIFLMFFDVFDFWTALGWFVLFDSHVLDVSMVFFFLFDGLTHMWHVGFDSRVEHPIISNRFPHCRWNSTRRLRRPKSPVETFGWNRRGDVMSCRWPVADDDRLPNPQQKWEGTDYANLSRERNINIFTLPYGC